MVGRPGTEERLLARAREGDVDAYGRLVREYEGPALRTAAAITSNAADAEEAVQDAFLKAYAALDRLRPDAPLRPWLLTIVANEARNRRRSAGRRERLAQRAAHDDARTPSRGSDAGLDAAALSAERRAELGAALGRLPASDREVLGYRYLLELSEAETAEALGVRRGTVKSRLSRALDRLRVELGVAAILLALLVALLVASPDARSTVLRWLGLEGARVERREPAVPPARLRAPLDLGDRVSPGELRRRLRFAPVLPRLQALGPPSAVYLDARAAPGGAVTFTWPPAPPLTPRAAPGRPALLLTEVVGAVRPVIGKAVGTGTRVEPVSVRGEQGLWLAGAPHEFAFLDAKRELRPQTVRLAGPTLLWERGRLLLRLEGAASRQAALRIAASVGRR